MTKNNTEKWGQQPPPPPPSRTVTIAADSIADGIRLTTVTATLPKFLVAELNTHRMLSRNSASSRAIPTARRRAQPRYAPERFGPNRSGMSPGAGEVPHAWAAGLAWRFGALTASLTAWSLGRLGVHKQWATRPLEPYSWTTVVITATDWSSFLKQRAHPDAQDEIRFVAEDLRDALASSEPRRLSAGEWHTPFVREHEEGLLEAPELSAARAAAVSYGRHMVWDRERDMARFRRLVEHGHWSPLEHTAMVDGSWWAGRGNFRKPWVQLRKMVEGAAP